LIFHKTRIGGFPPMAQIGAEPCKNAQGAGQRVMKLYERFAERGYHTGIATTFGIDFDA
jgi:hypothetical protein